MIITVSLAAGERIKLNVDFPPEIKDGLKEYPVHCGIPFPKDALSDVANVRIVDSGGNEVPAQIERTGTWSPNGPVKWAGSWFIAEHSKAYFAEFGKDVNRKAVASKLSVVKSPGKITVVTGPAKYEITGNGIENVWISESGNFTDQDKIVSDNREFLYFEDQNGKKAVAVGNKLTVESSGPVCAEIKLESPYFREKEPVARQITRLQFYEGQSYARVIHTFIFTRKTEEVWYKDIGLELKSPGRNFKTMTWSPEEAYTDKIESTLLPAGQRLYLAQTMYPHFGQNDSEYILASFRGKTVEKIKSGKICGDWVDVSDGAKGLALICKDLAKQFPKGIEAGADGLKLHFWSSLGGMNLDFNMETLIKFWDLEGWAKALKRPEDVPAARKIKTNPLGFSKTHEVLIYPHPLAGTPTANHLAQAFREGVYAAADPQWIYRTKAVPFFYPKDEKKFPDAEGFIAAYFDDNVKIIPDWGCYGFLYYGSFPLGTKNVGGKIYGDFFRYNFCDYVLKDSVWYLYLRSGERKYRRFAELYSRNYMDGIFLHDESGGVPGGYRQGAGEGAGKSLNPDVLPMPWDTTLPGEKMKIILDNSSSSTLGWLFYYYYTSGDRRAQDVALLYKSAAEKEFANKGTVMNGYCPIRGALRHVVQLYGFTWDKGIKPVAEEAINKALDMEVSSGIAFNFRDQGYGAYYKHQVMITGIMDYYLATGDERAKKVILKNANFRMAAEGASPISYNNSVGMLYHLAYQLTGDWKYAGAARLYFDRGVYLGFDPGGKAIKQRANLSLTRYVFQSMPAMMDLAMTAKEKGASFPKLDQTCSGIRTSFVFKKEKNKEVWFDVWCEKPLIRRISCMEGKNQDFRAEYEGAEDEKGATFTLKLPKEVGANDGGKYLFSGAPLVGGESGAQADDEHLEREEDAGNVKKPGKTIIKANPKGQTKPTASPASSQPVLQNVKDSITFEKVPQKTLILKLKTEKPLLLSDRLFHASNGKARIRFSGYEGASQYSHLKTRFRIILDASSDEGEYIFSPNDSGATWSVLDDSAEKLVLHMPDGANLDGRMPPGRRPIWYFWVSKDKKPEIFLNHKVVLIDPNGEKIVKGGETGAWHELPGIEGLWGIEPDDVTYVNFRGIPPYMAKEDKSRFFIPSNNNKSETVVQDFSPDNKEPFQKGVFGRAYLLADKTNLQIPFGSEKGDGSHEYFPSQDGTLEFWFKPNWNSMELKPSDMGTRLLSASNGKFHLSYYFDPVNANANIKNSLYSQITGEGLNVRTAKPHTMRVGDYRSTIFSAGQWYHIAMVWYHPYSTIRKSEKTLEIFTYVDGKRGQIFGHWALGINYKVVKMDGPLEFKALMNGLIDEVRISDIPRYKDDFIPPKAEFVSDANSRMLIHLNGDLKAVIPEGKVIELGK